MSRQRIFSRNIVPFVASILLGLAAWHFGVIYFEVPGYVLPKPAAVWTALVDGLGRDPFSRASFLYHLGDTLKATVAGFVIGGLVGFMTPGSTIANAHYNIDAVSITGTTPTSAGVRSALTGLITTGGLFGTQYTTWFTANLDGLVATNTTTLEGYFGAADTDGYYKLASVQSLKDYLGYSDQTTLKFKLNGNISFDSVADKGVFVPYVSGLFNPNGKTITNLTLSQNTSNLAFIGYVNGRGDTSAQVLDNWTITNASVVGKLNVGSAVGASYVRGITNITASGSVTGSDVGYTSDPSDNIYGSSTNTGYSNAGGVVGFINATSSGTNLLNNVTSSVAVTGGTDVGGIAGRVNTGTLTNSTSSGAINGGSYVGGLAGRLYYGSVTDSSSTSAVTGSGNYVGGLLGALENGNSSLKLSSHTDGLVKGVSYVGGLIGQSDGTIGDAVVAATPNYSTFSTNNVEASGDYVGGLIGLANSGSVKNASASGTVTGYTLAGVPGYSGYYTGGLIGYSNTPVTYSKYTGLLVKGSHQTGGLIGSNRSSIADSYSTGQVQSNSSYVGGLAGFSSGSITGFSATVGLGTTYATGNVTAFSHRVGGLVGEAYYGSDLTKVYATGTVSSSSNSYVGGLVGLSYVSINYATATGNVSGSDRVGGLVGESQGSINNATATGSVNGSWNIGGFVGRNYSSINSSTSSGNVTGTSEVGGFVGANYATIGQSGVISATGSVQGVNSVGGFSGYSNNSIYRATYSNAGAGVRGTSQVGGFVGYFSGWSVEIPSATTTTAVVGTGTDVGGFVGFMTSGSSISSSTSTGSVTGSTNTGGFVGRMNDYSSVSGSTASSSVTGGVRSGGFVGYMENNSSISASGTSGSVTGTTETGGFVGSINYYSWIDRSYSNANTTGTTNVGGFAGYFNNYSGYDIANSRAAGSVDGTSNVGGFVGYTTRRGSIYQSYSTGRALATQDYVGGFGGYVDNAYYGTMSDFYSSSAVRGRNYVGGLFGNVLRGTFTNAYATGYITSTSATPTNIGATFGNVDNTESHTRRTVNDPWVYTYQVNRNYIYYDTDTTGQSGDVTLTGLTSPTTGLTTATGAAASSPEVSNAS